MPSSRVRATNASKSSNVPRSGWIASCPPSADPIAHGEPGSPGCGVSVLFRPLRNEMPIGCTGGRYTTSKPMAATASSRPAAVRNVPDTGAVWPEGSTWAPSDRGKNSYHAPYSARCRSTCTVSALDRVTSSRSGHRARISAMARSCGPREPVERRPRAVAHPRHQRAQRGPGRRRAGGAGRLGDPPRGPLEQQRALGQHQLHVLAGRDLDRRVVLPAGDRVGPRLHVEAPQSLLRHGHVRAVAVRAGSELAHRRDRARPGPVAMRSGSRSTTPTPMTPCPSRKTVALTPKVSPATAFAGRMPHSTAGSTSRIGIRPITLVTLPTAGRLMPARVPVYNAWRDHGFPEVSAGAVSTVR